MEDEIWLGQTNSGKNMLPVWKYLLCLWFKKVFVWLWLYIEGVCVGCVQAGLKFSGQRFTSGQSKSLIFSADFIWFPRKKQDGCQLF